jgi:hypothetical protein
MRRLILSSKTRLAGKEDQRAETQADAYGGPVSLQHR